MDTEVITLCRLGSERGEPSAVFLRTNGFPNARYVINGFRGAAKMYRTDLKQQGAFLLNVRSAAEFAGGSAPGTFNIPLPELAKRLHEIPTTVPVVLCCASGTRSGMAKRMLKKKGYKQVFNIGKWRNLLL